MYSVRCNEHPVQQALEYDRIQTRGMSGNVGVVWMGDKHSVEWAQCGAIPTIATRGRHIARPSVQESISKKNCRQN